MSGNFVFLSERFSVLEKIGGLAENYLYADPNACLYKMGIFAETMVNCMFEIDKRKQPTGSNNTQANKLKILQNDKIIDAAISGIFHRLRVTRNEAVHSNYDSFEDSVTLIEQTHTLSVWFMRAYGDPDYEPLKFVMPEDIRGQKDYKKIIEENERLAAELEKALAAALAKPEYTRVSKEERRRRAENASRGMRLSEREIRFITDEQLRRAGWEADTFSLRYSKGTRPQKNRNIAIAEWPTDLTVCMWGYMSYALFAGLKMVGTVEIAVDRFTDLPDSVNVQCREYSMGVKEEHHCYVIDMRRRHKVPFLFAANARAYEKERALKTGVWFCDMRGRSKEPRALHGWYSPDELLALLGSGGCAADADRALKDLPIDTLCGAKGLGLRPYQAEALMAAETAVLNGKKTALLKMAAGTGKTRIVPGMVHRYLKTGRFKRILLLVDETSSGGQVPNIFKELALENGATADKLYRIRGLNADNDGGGAEVCVSTVRDMRERIFLNGGESAPTVAEYDLIIADDALHGFPQKKEADGGLDADDYLAALEYFDAVKIILAADETCYPPDILGEPVFSYPG
ncbi:MAG: DEAD/DEAH box helicase family protein [Defluviitaleaceae bacterium]|nr:DEAD/DEAH box helicase family protein [Defluviitaleaceae bacterium]